MKKFRKFTVFLLCASLLMCLAACGSTTEPSSNEAPVEVPSDNDDGDEEVFILDGPGEIYEPEPEVLPIGTMVGAYTDYDWSDDTQTGILSYAEVALTDSYAELYPALSQALSDAFRARAEEMRNSYDAMMENVALDMESGTFYGPYRMTEAASVRRADSSVTSILISGYFYGGGAHGTPYYAALNFNSQTGETLKLSDIVDDGAFLGQLVQAQLEEEYRDVNFYASAEDYFTDLDSDAIVWTLDRSGLTIWFGVYELAPYSEGSLSVTIPFAGNDGLFTVSRDRVTESCAVQLTLGAPYYIDLDGDATLNRIELNAIPDEYDWYNSVTVCVDGSEQEFEIYGYSIVPFLICTVSGTNALYLQLTAENDYKSVEVLRLEPGAASEVGSYNIAFESLYREDGLTNYFTILPTGAEDMWMTTRLFIMGTRNGEKRYSVSNSGEPVTDDAMYQTVGTAEVTLNLPLTANVLDTSTGEASAETVDLAAGTVLQFIATDGNSSGVSACNLQTADGTVVRVNVDCGSWPHTINGTDIEELFSGIIFAG